MEEKYISLKEASKICEYSQDYLGLRSRQGKLKAVKIGRNWVTKKEWIEEYVEDYNNNYFNAECKRSFFKFRNLVIVSIVSLFFATILLPGIFLTIERWYNEESLSSSNPREEINFSLADLQKASLVEKLKYIMQDNVSTFREFGKWMTRGVRSGYQYVMGTPKKNEEDLPNMVVFSKKEDYRVVVQKVKSNFSDEVKVIPTDKESGIIIPLFKEREGEEYFYMLLPRFDKN